MQMQFLLYCCNDLLLILLFCCYSTQAPIEKVKEVVAFIKKALQLLRLHVASLRASASSLGLAVASHVTKLRFVADVLERIANGLIDPSLILLSSDLFLQNVSSSIDASSSCASSCSSSSCNLNVALGDLMLSIQNNLEIGKQCLQQYQQNEQQLQDCLRQLDSKMAGHEEVINSARNQLSILISPQQILVDVE
jgi:hypothetical protein